MAYFPNGASGGDYREKYCDNCVHDKNDDCPIWALHLMHNYEECNNDDSFLEVLIPRDGIENQECKLFIPNAKSEEPSDGS